MSADLSPHNCHVTPHVIYSPGMCVYRTGSKLWGLALIQGGLSRVEIPLFRVKRKETDRSTGQLGECDIIYTSIKDNYTWLWESNGGIITKIDKIRGPVSP